MLVPIQMGTNMVAGNQWKHLSLFFFCYKSVNLSLEKLKNNKIILFSNCSDSQIPRNKSRNKSLFNQLGRHANAASCKSLQIQA